MHFWIFLLLAACNSRELDAPACLEEDCQDDGTALLQAVTGSSASAAARAEPQKKDVPAAEEGSRPTQPAADTSLEVTETKCQIFTFWDYKSGPPLSVALNVEGWRRHAHPRCGDPVLISDDNVLTYIPDMPEEYFRMPYSQAKADLVRYAVLYHHGGIYMDTDILVVQDLDAVVDLIQSYDLLSYTDAAAWFLQGFEHSGFEV
ncbi:unnamed protein product [Symbiodinium pilosum]|uniref:Alpha 1,4-glycosyltransferase domain-containing protein n=1 Tax=Symbiodinium pilosum TaxID=2952 RepID=A0A812LY84_SYMPI|nr:unnamed protein product [Symbiodinium pilosum]